MKSLYIHIPFCNTICNYCDFVKRVSNNKIKEDYMCSLIKELHAYKENYKNLKTIYIGGGTPTSMDTESLEKLLKEINALVDMSLIEEFSIESNVETLTIEKITLLKAYGVNRVSIGVQTFDPGLLKLIGRKHTKEEVFTVVENLKEMGITNINIDMMFAIPTQSNKELVEDLNTIKELNVEHVSYYSLILEENTVFSHWLDKGKIELVDNLVEAQMYTLVMQELVSMGYKQYEISNFTKHKESEHNKTYWHNGHYVGIGLGAHGYIGDVRYDNTTDILKYINKEFINGETELDQSDKMGEELILGLRLLKGVSLTNFKNKFNIDLFEVYPFVNEQIELGLLELVDDHLRLSKKGLMVGNDIFELFL